ncbi:MAG TPA: NnrU family protein [Candidatus Binataceae bacterium]|nr:NnrU family protein [Candidatus Binataceae bacterium]
MDPVVAIALWALLFLGSHLVISSRAVRPRLTAMVGEQAYPGIYSIVALATFIPMCLAFARHKHSGAMLWNLRDVPAMRYLVWLAMLFAFIVLIASFITPNPGAMGAQGAARKTSVAHGVLKLSRHPSFVAFSAFGLAHMLMNGFVGDLIFFGTFPALSIIGGMHQDARKEVQLGESYQQLEASTSFFPALALISGRQHWTSRDTPWMSIAIGLALTALLLWLHPMIFGGHPLGM